MTRYRVADLCQRPIFIAMLRALSHAEDFALVFRTDWRCHVATFVTIIGGAPWTLQVPIASDEIDRAGMFKLIEYGNRMIADVEAHYRQQAVAR